MFTLPTAKVEFSFPNHRFFVLSSLSLGEEQGQHVHCVVPSHLILASLGCTAIG